MARRGEPLRYFNEVVLVYEGNACLIWPYARHAKGYGQLRIDGRTQTVSRLVCERANGPPSMPKHEAAHSCGNGHLGCVNPNHLSWKTHAGNMAEMVEHGTSPKGERQGNAKVTVPEVREILALKGVLLQREIAAKYGVSPRNVSNIHRGDSWGWLGRCNI